MIEGLKPYAEYKESALPWVGVVPSHWKVDRLRHVCQMLVSNVDKHTKPGEMPVRLCNYVDVYKHRTIRRSINFMRATATRDEVSRFRIFRGDVIITKDSEEWTDIGVPSLVEYEADDLVCGYHLAILRSRTELCIGGYLLRALQCTPIATQLHVEAHGVTRYGLSHGAIKDVSIPLPSLEEQKNIACFLDHANRKIDGFIRSKRKLIGLLNEQKQAIIHRAVTRGLDPSVPLKPSGIPWLGDIPQHWDQQALWKISRLRVERNPGGLPLLSVFLDRGVIRYEEGGGQVHAPSLDLSNYQVVRPGDFVLNNQQAWRGSVGVSQHHGIISPAYIVLKMSPRLDSTYANFLVRCRAMVNQFVVASKGVGDIQRQVFWPFLRYVQVPVPSLDEQESIVDHLAGETRSLNNAIARTEREIALMQEYRTRLTADVVTGKLDVRAAAASLPSTDESATVTPDVDGDDLDPDEDADA